MKFLELSYKLFIRSIYKDMLGIFSVLAPLIALILVWAFYRNNPKENNIAYFNFCLWSLCFFIDTTTMIRHAIFWELITDYLQKGRFFRVFFRSVIFMILNHKILFLLLFCFFIKSIQEIFILFLFFSSFACLSALILFLARRHKSFSVFMKGVASLPILLSLFYAMGVINMPFFLQYLFETIYLPILIILGTYVVLGRLFYRTPFPNKHIIDNYNRKYVY